MRNLFKKRQNKGFALGLILMVIVLLAIITSFFSAGYTRFDPAPEVSQLDVARLRNGTGELVQAITRIADSCPKRVNSEYKTCIKKIRTSLRQTSPCEKDVNPEILTYCPYSPLYGGAARVPLPKNIFVDGIQNWDIAYDVKPQTSSNTIDMVLTINDLSKEACLKLEQLITNNRITSLPQGIAIKTGGSGILPMNRREGCFAAKNIVGYNDQIIDRPHYQQPIILATNLPGGPDDTASTTKLSFNQYFAVIGSFHD